MSLRQAFRTAFLVIALVLLLTGAVQAVTTALFLLRADRVPGTVVDYRVTEGAAPPFMQDDGRLYYAVVEFSDPDGRPQRVTSPRGRRSRTIPVGTEVSVFRHAGRSGSARIDSPMDLWGGTVIFSGLALLFLVIGLAAPMGFRRSRPQSPRGPERPRSRSE